MPTAISTARNYSLACREHACANGLGRERECKLSRVLLDLLSHASALHFWAHFSDVARAFHVVRKECAHQDFRQCCFRMGRKRVVPNYNSGYASYKEKVITFKVPSDPVKLEAWVCAIPRKDRALTSHGYICEKHFSESHIKRRQYVLWQAWWQSHSQQNEMTCVVTRCHAIYISTLSQLPSVRKTRWPTGPDVKCGKRMKTKT